MSKFRIPTSAAWTILASGVITAIASPLLHASYQPLVQLVAGAVIGTGTSMLLSQHYGRRTEVALRQAGDDLVRRLGESEQKVTHLLAALERGTVELASRQLQNELANQTSIDGWQVDRVDLSGLELRGSPSMRRTRWTNSSFTGSRFHDITLEDSTISGELSLCEFQSCNLSNVLLEADLSLTHLVRCDLSYLTTSHAAERTWRDVALVDCYGVRVDLVFVHAAEVLLAGTCLCAADFGRFPYYPDAGFQPRPRIPLLLDLDAARLDHALFVNRTLRVEMSPFTGIRNRMTNSLIRNCTVEGAVEDVDWSGTIAFDDVDWPSSFDPHAAGIRVFGGGDRTGDVAATEKWIANRKTMRCTPEHVNQLRPHQSP